MRSQRKNNEQVNLNGGNSMKQINFLFLISVRRAELLSVTSKLLLCLPILLGMVIITGCDREDSSTETLAIDDLKICGLDPDAPTVGIGDSVEVTVKWDYSGESEDLECYWDSAKGTIYYSTDETAIYVAPKEKCTDIIMFEISDGNVTISEFLPVKVTDPDETDSKATNNTGNSGD